jgi:phosphatidylinositol alpha-mannosyltransferase
MTKSQRKLSIAFLFDDSLDSFDGVSQYVKLLGAYYTGLGHKVSYLVGETKMTEWAGGTVYSLSKNVRVSFNGNRLSMPLPASKKRIRQIVAAENFDVIHVQVPYSPFMAKYVINAAGPQTAVVGTFHILPSGFLSSAGSRFLKTSYGRSLKRIDAMAAVSPVAADFARETLGVKSLVIPNTVDIDKFKNSSKQPNTNPRIVFLGRLVKRKGAHELIKAFKILSQLTDANLIIGGKGPELANLRKFVAKNKLGDKVEFQGFIDEKDKPSFLGGANIACFPSTGGESFGIVLIEAMAAGAGVTIGGDNPGYRSVLNERPKLLVNPKNSQEFAARLLEFITEKDLAKELHDWQNKTIKQYDISIVGQKLLEQYLIAIDKRSSPRHN